MKYNKEIKYINTIQQINVKKYRYTKQKKKINVKEKVK